MLLIALNWKLANANVGITTNEVADLKRKLANTLRMSYPIVYFSNGKTTELIQKYWIWCLLFSNFFIKYNSVEDPRETFPREEVSDS